MQFLVLILIYGCNKKYLILQNLILMIFFTEKTNKDIKQY